MRIGNLLFLWWGEDPVYGIVALPNGMLTESRQTAWSLFIGPIEISWLA